MKIFNIYTMAISCMLIVATGCKKLIEADLPVEKIAAKDVFAHNGSAIAAVSSVYAGMGANASGFITGTMGLSIRPALAADELRSIIGEADYLNNYNAIDGWPSLWQIAYRDDIYQLNAAIEGLSAFSGVTSSVKQILMGEAKFTRAWIYFYLLNHFGEVPLVLATDFRQNEQIGRSSVERVYAQMIKDLLEAQQLLPETYKNAQLTGNTTERVRPNRLAATALLSRVYLYKGKWALAESESSKLIAHPDLELLGDLSQVFLKNSRETIWALQPQLSNIDGSGVNTPDGKELISLYGFMDPTGYLTESLLNAFEPGDQRLLNWTAEKPQGRIPFKYKEGYGSSESKEYSIVLRLAEQYLIRAEARVRQGKLTGMGSAASDLNAIRNRAGLSDTDATTELQLLDAIDRERRIELFLEWGDRWLNLKRRGKLDEVMAAESLVKGTEWKPYKALLPIPFDEFKWNPALRGNQNPGYNQQ